MRSQKAISNCQSSSKKVPRCTFCKIKGLCTCPKSALYLENTRTIGVSKKEQESYALGSSRNAIDQYSTAPTLHLSNVVPDTTLHATPSTSILSFSACSFFDLESVVFGISKTRIQNLEFYAQKIISYQSFRPPQLSPQQTPMLSFSHDSEPSPFFSPSCLIEVLLVRWQGIIHCFWLCLLGSW